MFARHLSFASICVGFVSLSVYTAAPAVERGNTSAVASITQEQIKSFSIANLNEAIARTPGVVVQTPSESAPASIRGYRIDGRPDVVVDGVFMGPNYGLAFDSAEIERIEFLRGPQGTLFGGSNPAGTVLINTKGGRDVPVNRFNPGNLGYSFGNLLRNQNLAIDSLEQCDYTPGLSLPAYSLGSLRKTPAEERQWDAEWEAVRDLSGDRPVAGELQWKNDALYRFPAYEFEYGSNVKEEAFDSWFYFSETPGKNFLKKYYYDFDIGSSSARMDAPAQQGGDTASPAPAASAAAPWYAEFRGGIPSWGYISRYSPCSDAQKAKLKPWYDQHYKAMGRHYGYLSDISRYAAKRDNDAVRAQAAEQRGLWDTADDEIRKLLRQCPGGDGAGATATTAGNSGGTASSPTPTAAPESTPELAPGAGLGLTLPYGMLPDPWLDLRVQYSEEVKAELETGPNTAINIGPRVDLGLPLKGAYKDVDTGAGANPVRVFTQNGRGGIELDDQVINDLGFSRQQLNPIYKGAFNYAALRGFTQPDPRWPAGSGSQTYEEDYTSYGGGLKLGWDLGRFTVGVNIPWDKYDSRVVRHPGLGDSGITAVPDLYGLKNFGAITPKLAPYLYDVVTIGPDLWTAYLYPERSGLRDEDFNALPGQDYNENNTCADEALPPPGDPAFKSRGAWGQDFDDQWAIKRVGFTDTADSAWSAVKDSATPIIVGVIDTGLDWHHLDIDWANLWRNEGEIPGNLIDDDGNGYVDDIIGWDFLNNGNEPWDYDGHGTFVTGIIAADRDNAAGIAGINPNVRIMVLKALNSFGHTRASHIAKAIVYGAENGARILNLSVAGPGMPEIVRAAVEYAESKGVLVVAAAGNTGESADNVQPAGLPGVLTVAATDLDDRRASFSNYGTEIDIAAPGIEIMSLRARRTDFMWNTPDDEQYRPGDAYLGDDKRYYRSAGTSFSTPIVTGVASLVWANDPSLTAADVRRIIEQSARDIETPGRDQFSGYGLVDARAAMAADPAFFVEVLISGAAAVEDKGKIFLEIQGSLDADELQAGWLEFGPGEEPTAWQRVDGDLRKPVKAGALGRIPAEDLGGATTWTIRLVGEHKNGQRKEYRFQVDLG